MPSGVMVRWNAEKGFGFIKPDNGGDDLFCHVTGLRDGDGSVRDGDAVTFREEYDDRKGKDRAVDVQVSGGGGGGGRSRSRSRGRSPPRRSGGGGYGGGGGGETRPGDWECPSCRANVFASKDACFKCGEPKPSGGGGGGRDRRDDRDRDRRY
mmetsp:Transcript_1896/g.5566  ORF Transcript_1896/g.5566 Transcript_1896/m.5566 type:complete len:153 (+) Transcript_1896:88-546(+)